MANSISPHSVKLRAKTAIKAVQEKRKKGIYAQINILGKAELITQLKNNLEKIKGTSNLDKLLKVTDEFIQKGGNK